MGCHQTLSIVFTVSKKGSFVCATTRRLHQSIRHPDLPRVLSSSSQETIGIEVPLGSYGLHWHGYASVCTCFCVYRSIVYTTAAQDMVTGL